MIRTIEAGASGTLAAFDAVFDVRSPGEFAQDRLPGAENLPALSDQERSEVGRIYVQGSKFEARRLGAALIARNAARHLEDRLRAVDGGFQPLIYCWRGGGRSRAMALILSEVGWRVSVLAGGYRSWRRRTVERLYEARPPWRFIVLAGGTGSGKTEILSRLQARGAQVLDLEALAGHRGSLFGARDAPQPSQKRFESLLIERLETLSLEQPIFVEDESSRIGERFLPPAVIAALSTAPRLEILVPLEARARYVARAYADFAASAPALRAAIDALPRHHSKASRDRWRRLADAGAFEGLAAELIEAHYDPAYERGLKMRAPAVRRIDLPDLASASQDIAADAALQAAGVGAAPGGAPEAPGAVRPRGSVAGNGDLVA